MTTEDNLWEAYQEYLMEAYQEYLREGYQEYQNLHSPSDIKEVIKDENHKKGE